MENKKNNEIQTDATTELKAKTKSPKNFKRFYLVILAFIILGVISLVYFLKPEPKESFTNSIGMKMIWVPAGQFKMGNHSEYAKNVPCLITLSKGFWIAQTEVTQSQYEAVMGTNPSHHKDETCPVEKVSWYDAMDFCKKLSKKERKDYTLPTEARWEYACRAGSTTAYCFGDESRPHLHEFAWYEANCSKTQSVGQKRPNDWGLYDMHGNVYEWCLDWYSQEYYNNGPLVDPQGESAGERRVIRSGSFGDQNRLCRSYFRYDHHPDRPNNAIGFRIVRLQ